MRLSESVTPNSDLVSPAYCCTELFWGGAKGRQDALAGAFHFKIQCEASLSFSKLTKTHLQWEWEFGKQGEGLIGPNFPVF